MIKLGLILLSTIALVGGAIEHDGPAKARDKVTAPVDLIDPPQR